MLAKSPPTVPASSALEYRVSSTASTLLHVYTMLTEENVPEDRISATKTEIYKSPSPIAARLGVYTAFYSFCSYNIYTTLTFAL